MADTEEKLEAIRGGRRIALWFSVATIAFIAWMRTISNGYGLEGDRLVGAVSTITIIFLFVVVLPMGLYERSMRKRLEKS